MSKNFAITGVGGYVAPRHLKAIRDTGNQLVAAVDPFDSVGVLDQYFFGVSYFKEFERFDRHIEKLRRGPEADGVDFVSICSPNYIHDAHIRFALRVGAHAICEKPLVLNPWNCDALEELEQEFGKRVYNVLQLRVHPAVRALREKYRQSGSGKKREIILTYNTSRGPWYLYSWKGNPELSGGLASNIGVHFFDMLLWLFGSVEKNEVHVSDAMRCGGYLELERARVRWFLSIDRDDLPESCRENGQTTFRSITVDGEEVEFSGGFTDLHTMVYQDILEGGGYGIAAARPAIEIVHDIRKAEVVTAGERGHPNLV